MTNLLSKTVLIIGLLSLSSWNVSAQGTKIAIANFTAGGKGVMGKVKFVEQDKGAEIIGQIQGLPVGEHGLHVHEIGSLDDNCNAAGGHFNPLKMNHGAPSDSERHIGDLGNIVADSSGKATFNLNDPLIELEGPNSIIGRALVIHEGRDDLGQGGVPASLKNGDAKGRIACGIISLQ
ncbi:hypothetical protein K7432_014093 [Basidiobolus ranarum]|uniref:Superoxide dismutase copper/zinc binding domain-containing protein n=1 Tax=Basidiobolus ranarum TaxID=34480 RepID=A0ABR2WI75_9FUNG